MATQEERINGLINRLQGERPNVRTSVISPAQRYVPMREYSYEPIEPGSLIGDLAGQPMPVQPPEFPQAMPPPPPLITPREDMTKLDLFTGGTRGVGPDPLIEPTDESDNPLVAFGRGIGRGGAQTGIAIGEGLFSIADMAANVTGYEDLIDPETSEVFKDLNEARKIVGNERTVVGKLGQAVGSMLTFMIPGIGAVSQAGRAASLLSKGAQYANAAKRAKGLAIGFRGLQGAAAIGSGSGQASQMMREYKEAGGDYTTGQRNLAIFWGMPIGALELIGPEMILRGFGKDLANPIKNEILRRLTGLGANATGEGAQEALSGILQEYAAKEIYDPERPIGDSMLSDFGYGAGAAAILDLVIGKRTPDKPVKDPNEIQNEYITSNPIDPVDATLLQGKIGTEETVPIYDKGGNQVDALVSSVDIDKGTAEVTVEDEVIQLPLDSYPNQDGISFASNESLYSPGRYTVNGRELGQLKDEELRQLSFDIALTDDLKQQVANGEISQAEANEQTDLTRLNARQQYDLAAIGEELKRRGFEVESSSPDVEQDLKAANQQKQIDSGEYSDNIDKNLGEIGKGTLYDTYFDTDAPTKGAVDDLTQSRKDKALKDIEERTDLNE